MTFAPGDGVQNMLRVGVCAALGPMFSLNMSSVWLKFLDIVTSFRMAAIKLFLKIIMENFGKL